MKRFYLLFLGSAIPFALVLFAIAISNNSWQRALGLAVIMGFLFGSSVAQGLTWWLDRRDKNKRD
jgi:RsiW-degrading membrane proteinase PrsW (M82 family)